MIYIDNRTGSKELLSLFPRGTAELTHLDYADFMFTGHYEDGDIVIGIERKTIGDFVNCMCSGRLSGHQLIGMLNSYHYVYIIIEGIYRAHPVSGILQLEAKSGDFWYDLKLGERKFMARDVWAFQNTLEVVCGLHCDHTPTPSDTAYYIRALKHWWTKEYEEHRGHLQPHTGTTVELSKQTLVRRVAACLDGVGWGKAKALDMEYDSVIGLAAALEKELMEVEGIGKKLAKSIVDQIHGR